MVGVVAYHLGTYATGQCHAESAKLNSFYVHGLLYLVDIAKRPVDLLSI